MKDVIILHDGTRIEIEDGASLSSIIHIAQDEKSAVAVCNKITPANLVTMKVVTNGNVIADYEKLQIAHVPTRATNEDGTVTVTISLRERSSVEARLDSIEEEQEIQNAAIDYLAME